MPRIRLTDHISKTATFTEGLDQIAAELETQGYCKLALHIDCISDQLERKGKVPKPIVHKPGDPPDLVMTGDPKTRDLYEEGYKPVMEQINVKGRKK